MMGDELRARRLARAKNELEHDIDHSAATPEQKAFMRQRLAHLWTLVSNEGGTRDRS